MAAAAAIKTAPSTAQMQETSEFTVRACGGRRRCASARPFAASLDAPAMVPPHDGGPHRHLTPPLLSYPAVPPVSEAELPILILEKVLWL